MRSKKQQQLRRLQSCNDHLWWKTIIKIVKSKKKLGACSRRTYIAHGLGNFPEKKCDTPFLLKFLENKCDTSTKLTQSLWQAYMYTYVRGIWAKRFEKNNSDTTKTGMYESMRLMYEADFSFSRSRQEGRPWGASTGGLVHTAARIKRTEGRGRSSLSARYKAMRTSRSNQYRLWH